MTRPSALWWFRLNRANAIRCRGWQCIHAPRTSKAHFRLFVFTRWMHDRHWRPMKRIRYKIRLVIVCVWFTLTWVAHLSIWIMSKKLTILNGSIILQYKEYRFTTGNLTLSLWTRRSAQRISSQMLSSNGRCNFTACFLAFYVSRNSTVSCCRAYALTHSMLICYVTVMFHFVLLCFSLGVQTFYAKRKCRTKYNVVLSIFEV